MIILSFLSICVIFGPFCGCWLVVIGFWLSVIGCRFAVAGCRLVVIGCRSDRLQVSGPRLGLFSACLLLPVGNVPASQEPSKKGPFRALCTGSILVHAESWANVVYDPSRTFLRDIYRVIAAVQSGGRGRGSPPGSGPLNYSSTRLRARFCHVSRSLVASSFQPCKPLRARYLALIAFKCRA